MLKYIILPLFMLFTAVSAAAAAELRITDAANGAPVTKILRDAALKLVFSGDAVSMKRVLPSTGSVQTILRGETDILVTDRRFLPEKTDDIEVIPFAAEALCLYIHPGNPTGSLTPERVLEILTQERPRWKNPNLQKIDIQRIMLKPEIDGAGVHRRIFGEKNYASEVFRVSSPEQIFTFLTPAALGIAPFIPGTFMQVEFLPVNDIVPTAGNIISGKYPLTLQYVLICRRQAAPHIRKFIDSVLSDENRRQLPEYGGIPLWEKKP